MIELENFRYCFLLRNQSPFKTSKIYSRLAVGFTRRAFAKGSREN